MIKNIFGDYVYIGEISSNVHNEFKNDTVKQLLSQDLNDKNEYSSWSLCEVSSSYFSKKQFTNYDKINYDLLTDEIEKHVQTFLSLVNKDTSQFFDIVQTNTWVNIYNEHEFQELHDHISTKSQFACVYFMNYIPDEHAYLYFENDKYQIKTLSGITNIFKDNENYQSQYKPDVKEGSLIIFPCYFKHGVSVQKSCKVPRITVASNIGII
tara:strand:+ start:47 stop:676 length:630 start_codon:yes stop_codon:yes gene_type:complete